MNIGIMGNKAKKELPNVVSTLLKLLKYRNVRIFVDQDLAELFSEIYHQLDVSFVVLKELPSSCELLFALGGDGTILTAAKIINNKNVPILGVNLGKLGFLAGVSVSELEIMLNEVFENTYSLNERMVLQAKNSFNNTIVYALNDIVVDKGTSFRIIDIDALVNKEYLCSYTADGVIVSTPVGSTAYSLAVGGPIIVPSSEVISICPISPHNLTLRPVVVPNTSEIRFQINNENREIHLTADGHSDNFFQTPVEIIVSPAPFKIQLIQRSTHRYFDTLRSKFLWGKRFTQ